MGQLTSKAKVQPMEKWVWCGEPPFSWELPHFKLSLKQVLLYAAQNHNTSSEYGWVRGLKLFSSIIWDLWLPTSGPVLATLMPAWLCPLSLSLFLARGQGYPGLWVTSCPCVSSCCERQCGTQGRRMLVESQMPSNPGCTVQPLLPSISELLFSICEKETASLIGWFL